MVRNNLIIGVVVILLVISFVSAVAIGTPSITRNVPSTAIFNSSFTISYTSSANGDWDASIVDSVTEGCIFPNGISNYHSNMFSSNGNTKTITIKSSSSGICTFAGNYKFGNGNIINFPNQTITITSAENVSSDVAYIVQNTKKVDGNIVKSFNDLGFNVELIKDSNVKKTDFSKYKIVFIGDDILRNTAKYFDVSKYKTIIMNRNYGYEFGITDKDYISGLASNSPLNVNYGGKIVQVYTAALYGGGISIPYYYLSDANKAEGFKGIARAYMGNGLPFGDVVSVADAGAKMENGKTSKEKICFFGIAETSYWTKESKEIFEKDCISFVARECSSDEECDDGNTSTEDLCINPGVRGKCEYLPIECISNSGCGADGFVGSNFCDGKDVKKDYIGFTCNNAGTSSSFCSNATIKKLVERCPFGCSNGLCINGQHDVSLKNLEFKKGSGVVSNNIFIKNESYGILIDVFNKGDFIEKVNFTGEIKRGSGVYLTFHHLTIENLSAGDSKLGKSKTIAMNINPGYYNVSVEAFIANDNNLSNNKVQEQILIVDCITDSDCDGNQTCVNPGREDSYCSTPEIKCSSNSECGIDGFIGNNFCLLDDVKRSFLNFNCNNPGQTGSYCSNSTSISLIQDCGVNSTSNNFCYQDDIYKNVSARGCSNGGCFVNSVLEKVEECSLGCSNGGCINQNIVCRNNSDCEDNNPLTYDQCINPGTIASSCRNTEVNCADDLDCGMTGFVGNEYCSLNDILKNYQLSECKNKGTLESYCDVSIEQKEINKCEFACSSGMCIKCDSNADCNDNNPSTIDSCINPGTISSRCENERQESICMENEIAIKVASRKLIANDSQHVIDALPSNMDYNELMRLWDFDKIEPITSKDMGNLASVEPVWLSKGVYAFNISEGAWSRWRTDSLEFNSSLWSRGRNGGPGIVWESSAAVVYNNNGNLILDRFGVRNLFKTKTNAESASGSKLRINHNGGNLYVLIDDNPIYDNRGDITVDVYRCV